MNIGIDIDGVLTNIQDYVFEYGAKYTYEQGQELEKLRKNEYETSKIFNWQGDEDIKFWEKIFIEYAKNERLRFFASEVINKLKEKHKIYFITARSDMDRDSKERSITEIEKITKKWLEENDIPYDGIFFPGVDKRQVIIDNKIDVMIEDSAENIELIGDLTEVIVFDAIYNKEIENKIRVNSWYEILYYIERLEKENQKYNKR